jgi:hypothetical protein
VAYRRRNSHTTLSINSCSCLKVPRIIAAARSAMVCVCGGERVWYDVARDAYFKLHMSRRNTSLVAPAAEYLAGILKPCLFKTCGCANAAVTRCASLQRKAGYNLCNFGNSTVPYTCYHAPPFPFTRSTVPLHLPCSTVPLHLPCSTVPLHLPCSTVPLHLPCSTGPLYQRSCSTVHGRLYVDGGPRSFNLGRTRRVLACTAVGGTNCCWKMGRI